MKANAGFPGLDPGSDFQQPDPKGLKTGMFQRGAFQS